MIERVENAGTLLAIIIKSKFSTDGIEFFTPDDYSQQLGYMNRPPGYVIVPHVHNAVPREVIWTQEVIYVKSGKVRVDFYDNNMKYIKSRVLCCGDVILLATGGHGFKMLEQTEMIEVKQGPYCGELDKVRFVPVDDIEVNFGD
jgi:hypothetical protein